MNFAKALDFFDIALLQFQAANLLARKKIIGFNFTSVSKDLFCMNTNFLAYLGRNVFLIFKVFFIYYLFPMIVAKYVAHSSGISEFAVFCFWSSQFFAFQSLQLFLFSCNSTILKYFFKVLKQPRLSMHLHSLHTVSFLISKILLNRFYVKIQSLAYYVTVFQILQFYLDKVWSLCVIVLFCIVEYKKTSLFHVDITICIYFH